MSFTLFSNNGTKCEDFEGKIATAISAVAVTALFVLFVMTHFVTCCINCMQRRRERRGAAKKAATTESRHKKLFTKEMKLLKVLTSITGLSGLISTKLFSEVLRVLAIQQFASGSEKLKDSQINFYRAGAAFTGVAILLEYMILTLNNLRRGVWALPLSGMKLAVVAASMWVLTPCHNFQKTHLVLNWVLLGASLVITFLSYFMWAKYQRRKAPTQHHNNRVHLEIMAVLAAVVAIFTGDFLENTLSTTLDNQDSSGDPTGPIIVSATATGLAFVTMTLIGLQLYGASLVASFLLMAEVTIAIAWIQSRPSDSKFGYDVKFMGWIACSISVFLFCLTLVIFRRHRRKEVQLRALGQDGHKLWHVQIVRVFLAASSLFSVFLFTNSINELLNDENNSETEIRVGFVAAASLVLIIDFAIDLLVSFARYGWAFITSLLKVGMMLAAIWFTGKNISEYARSTIVFLYLLALVTAIVTFYLFVLKSWRSIVKWRKRRANKGAATTPDTVDTTDEPVDADGDGWVDAPPTGSKIMLDLEKGVAVVAPVAPVSVLIEKFEHPPEPQPKKEVEVKAVEEPKKEEEKEQETAKQPEPLAQTQQTTPPNETSEPPAAAATEAPASTPQVPAAEEAEPTPYEENLA